VAPAFSLDIPAWPQGARIPARFAFGQQADDAPVALAPNISPALQWSGAPSGTRSFAVFCHDPDVPSKPDDVNQAGREVPSTLPRVDFFHWVIVDISPEHEGLPEAAGSSGITARGKAHGPGPYGMSGINSYTDWFAGDPEMGGQYGQYDGPCPPWNDSIIHHYHFRVFALDVPSLGLKSTFTGPEALAATEGHVLGVAEYVGTYTLNPRLG